MRSSGGATILAGDIVSVVVYDGTDIYQLDPSEWTLTTNGVVLANNVPTHCTETGCVLKVALVIERAATETAGDPILYNGSEAVQVGQPILGAGDNVQFDSNGNVIKYTSSQTTQTVNESNYWNPTGHSQTITLNETPTSGFKAVIGGTTLTLGTDYTLSGRSLTITTTKALTVGASIGISYVGAVLHQRGEPEYTCTQTACTELTYKGTERALTVGNEPILYTGGQQVFYTAADPKQVGQAADQLTISGPGGLTGDIVYFGLSSVTVELGNEADDVTIDDAVNQGATTIQTAGGNDQVAVRQIVGPTTIQTGDGNNTVNVGSEAGFWPSLGFTDVKGNGNEIASILDVQAGNGVDTVNIDDTTDTAPNIGWLTSTQVGGIFKKMAAAVDYSGLETLNVNLGSAAGAVGNTFIVVSTSPGTVSNLTSGSGNDQFEVQSTGYTTNISTGDGNDVVRLKLDHRVPGRQSRSRASGSTLNGIDGGLVTITGGSGTDTLEAYDRASTGIADRRSSPRPS